MRHPATEPTGGEVALDPDVHGLALQVMTRAVRRECYTARITRIRERRNGHRHHVVCLVEAHHIGGVFA